MRIEKRNENNNYSRRGVLFWDFFDKRRVVKQKQKMQIQEVTSQS